MNFQTQSNSAPNKFTLRQAVAADLNALSVFYKSRINIHHHLDWRTSLEWLGFQPYYLLVRRGDILAALASPVDPEGVAWIRVFACTVELPPEKMFPILLERCVNDLSGDSGCTIAGLGLQDWFKKTLEENNFQLHQKIIVLGWDYRQRPAKPLPEGLQIRPMIMADLPAVAQVDRMAFKPIWQNSLDVLILALQKASIASVAIINEQIIGYQISTSTPINTHLARLAVNPAFQRQNIGYELVRDMLATSVKINSWQVSVNTQNDNDASLALYESLGFTKTGESFPVYHYEKPEMQKGPIENP